MIKFIIKKIFNINYDMPFLAAKNDDTKYYINLHVENNASIIGYRNMIVPEKPT